MKIAFVNLAVTGNAEQVEKGGFNLDSICNTFLQTCIWVHTLYPCCIEYSILKMKIEFVNLAVTGNAEQVEKGGVPSHTPHLKQGYFKMISEKGRIWLLMWKKKEMTVVRLNITKITMIKLMMVRMIKIIDTGSRCLAAPLLPNILKGRLLWDLCITYLTTLA